MTSRTVVFAEPVRTAIGTFGGRLKDTPAPELGAAAIGAAVARAGFARRGRHRRHGQRRPGRHQDEPGPPGRDQAGLPVAVPAMTVNRVCGSGAQAIVSAAQEISLGNVECRRRGRHGEHGPGAVPGRARPLGLPHGRRRRSTTACCATA